MAHIYKTTNRLNGKIYVGKSLREDPTYFGSGLLITAAISKYGKENFVKDILEECSEHDLSDRETHWIEVLNARDTKTGYNISIGGTGGDHYWKTLSEDEKIIHNEKISRSRAGQKTSYTEERRTNVKNGLAEFWKDRKTDVGWLKSRRENSIKNYLIVKDNEIIRIKGLKEFCTLNSLDIGWMTQISTGKKFRPSNGYYCIIDNNQSDDEIYSEIDRIKEEDKEIKQNWLEKTRTRPRYECIYCKKLVTKSNLTRWHNDKCKNNGSM